MLNLTLLKNLVIPAIGVIIFTCGWYSGSSYTEGVCQNKTLSKENESLKQALYQATQSQSVVNEYVNESKRIVDNSRVIIKKVPVYVTKENDDACDIPDSFRVYWNAANRGVFPDGPASTTVNGTTYPIRLSDVAAQHAREAETCKQTEAQLIALQDWVRSVVQEHKPP